MSVELLYFSMETGSASLFVIDLSDSFNGTRGCWSKVSDYNRRDWTQEFPFDLQTTLRKGVCSVSQSGSRHRG